MSRSNFRNKFFRFAHKGRAISREFRPQIETLEHRALLSCDGLDNLFHDEFDAGDLASNDNSGWSTAVFGGHGSETDSAFRFDGRQTRDWNLFEISSQDTFDVWNGESTCFEFRSGNAIVTGNNTIPTAFGDADLQTQFGVISNREARSGSGGAPDFNEANLYQNTEGGLYVELHYQTEGGDRALSVAGSIRFVNQTKSAWTSADTDPGVFSPATFLIPGYDGQEELITSISIDSAGWSVEFSHGVEVELVGQGVDATSNRIRGEWSEFSLDDAFITDEFVDGAYPFAMGQNVFFGRGAVDLTQVTVSEGGETAFVPDALEPNDSQHEPFDMGADDQFIDGLSIHHSGDEDWYRWTASRDGLLSVNLYANADQGDIDLELYSAAGELLDVSTNSGNHEGIFWQVHADDSYLFHVKSFNDSKQPSYKLTASNGPLTGESIYVAVDHEILVFNSNGEKINTFKHEILKSGDIGDVEIGPGGSVYVSIDEGGNAGRDGKIVQFSPTGTQLFVHNFLPEDAYTRKARYPYGFDVLEDGTFLIARPNSGEIMHIDLHGQYLPISTTSVAPAIPSDVTVKSTGEITFADDTKGESMLNPVPGGGYWVAELGSDRTTLRDSSGAIKATRAGVRPIDAEENQRGTLYITELTTLEPFAQGTLRALDRQGNTIFATPISGLPLGLAVSQGYRPARIPVDPKDIDSDGDGLLDSWETHGIDSNQDGRIDLDLPAMGADPMHKDLFVEIDTMAGRAPFPNVIDRLHTAFADVPNSLVHNPDGKDGINLHLSVDETTIPLRDFAPQGNPTPKQIFDNAWRNFDKLKERHFGTEFERSSPNWANIHEAKATVFRYGLIAENYHPKGASGLAELPGNDFMVTLGKWRTPGGTEDQQAGTFMHELGHTLGLKHGGGDHIQYKPNYHSVMNYHWQNPGALGNVGWSLDYSREIADTLFENNLDESRGLGFPNGSQQASAKHRVFIGGQQPRVYAREVGAVDFSQNDADQDGFRENDQGVKRDLNGGWDQNGDGKVSGIENSPGQTLVGHNDWLNLVYTTKHHNWADGVHQNAPHFELSEAIEHNWGDVNQDGKLDARDIDTLFAAIRAGDSDARFDLNRDDDVDAQDSDFLIESILGSTIGDANLDGVFDSSDLVKIFQAGEYEDTLAGNSKWATGDWNGDGEFNSGDLVLAFRKGTYTADRPR